MDNNTKSTSVVDRRLCVAPMLDWTDRHERFFLRLITRHTLLYTEMITTGALLHGDRKRFLAYDPSEHPVALQLGGNDPRALAECARLAQGYGYDEVNLNCGCPSHRVRLGGFGACLLAEPEQVARCVAAMGRAVSIPVTVKTRLGIDNRSGSDEQAVEEHDSYRDLARFMEIVAGAGCKTFIIHARKAWLAPRVTPSITNTTSLGRRQSFDPDKAALGACRAYGDRSEKVGNRGHFSAKFEENGELFNENLRPIETDSWTNLPLSQPIHPKSDRILGQPLHGQTAHRPIIDAHKKRGLSPAQNRKLPPLRYDVARAVKKEFPALEIVLNGGVEDPESAHGHLGVFDGVMMGRSAYHHPYRLASADGLIFADPHPVPSRREVIEHFIPYVEKQLAAGVPLGRMTRHILGLFGGQPGAGIWRRTISERAHRPGAGVEVIRTALGRV
uniref:tRNA-dihydrouridine(20/20a) synthase n=1 Tax=Candidatus Kentrum sp. FM TaxID=2126340 RepID=A0A450S8I2_9GAMM|nr:MAG: tRNA dihydrouridine synthase A [Candidatus Kentron sp. FM]VFK07974.1 MAG: tRNA dihydrouridine synthase A [Candidatus Kentron sp. FM]